MVECLHDF